MPHSSYFFIRLAGPHLPRIFPLKDFKQFGCFKGKGYGQVFWVMILRPFPLISEFYHLVLKFFDVHLLIDEFKKVIELLKAVGPSWAHAIYPSPAFLSKPVLLQSAGGLIGDGEFDKPI